MDERDEAALEILAWTAKNIGSASGLTGRQPVDYRSSVNVVGTAIDPDFRDRGVAALYDPPEVLRRLHEMLHEFRRNHPEMDAQESRTRAAVRALGIPLLDGRGNLLFGASWAHFDAVLTPEQHESLLPLIHWANNAGIEPDAITGAVMQRFAAEHLSGRDEKSAMQTVRRIVQVWNSVAPTLGLAAVPSPIPYADRGHYGIPEAEFAVRVRAQLDEAVRVWTTVPRRGRCLVRKVAEQRRYLIILTLSAYCRATGTNPGHINSLEEFLNV